MPTLEEGLPAHPPEPKLFNSWRRSQICCFLVVTWGVGVLISDFAITEEQDPQNGLLSEEFVKRQYREVWNISLASICRDSTSKFEGLQLVSSSNDPLRLRHDERCGPLFLNHHGTEAECNPNAVKRGNATILAPCCNRQIGWCGIGWDSCSCQQCVRFYDPRVWSLQEQLEHMPKTSPENVTWESFFEGEGTKQHFEADAGPAVKFPGFQQSRDVTRIFVIVPSLQEARHKPLLLHNIMWLQQQKHVNVTCMVCVNFTMVLTDSEIQPCLLERTGLQTGESIVNLPESLWADQDLVLIWSEGVALQPGATLNRMVEVMACNGLSVLSPSYRFEHVRDMEVPTPVMIQHLPFSSLPLDKKPRPQVGRMVSEIQWQFVLATPESFRCLRKLIIPEVNPTGAGSEDLFPFACAGRCMGVLDETTMHSTGLPSTPMQDLLSEKDQLFDELGEPQAFAESFGALEDPIEKCGARGDRPHQDWFSHPHPVAPLPPKPKSVDPQEKHHPWIIAWNASPSMLSDIDGPGREDEEDMVDPWDSGFEDANTEAGESVQSSADGDTH